MTAVSAFMPESANSVVLGSRAASAPKTTSSGEVDLEAGLEPVAQPRHARRPRRASSASAAAAAAPKAGDAGHVLGSCARAALLPAALDQRHRGTAPSRRV